MKNELPALVILVPGFAKDEDDSVCLPAQQGFIRSLNKNFPSLPVILFSFQYPFEKKEYSWHNNRVIAFGGKNKGGLSRLFLWSRVRKKFSELIKEQPVMGILSFWAGECALNGFLLARKYKLPHYCWIMGQDAKKENRYVKRFRPDPASLIAISDFSRDEFARHHLVMPAHVIPLGVARNTYKNEVRDIDLLGVGSLVPLKQYDLFITLAGELTKSYPGLKAVICGKGPEQKRLEELIVKNNLQANIELAGEKPHSKILEMMSRTKILLHPSSFEGFSGACLEALHAGAHVVSFTRPMKHDIANWHTLASVTEMKTKLFELLSTGLEHYPVNAYPAEAAAISMMKLFENKNKTGLL